MVASILQEAGYKVGLFTSPHLVDFRERIRINGQMISEEEVVRFVEINQSLIGDLQPSFFEWTAALAFDYFAEKEVDIAVFEVGLGGRLDSTNVVRSIVTSITSIGMDHANLLGDTIEKIATEKAGIIKEGVPIIIPTSMDGAVKRLIIDRAVRLGAHLRVSTRYDSSALNGAHQASNAGCARGIVHELKRQGMAITSAHMLSGFQNLHINTGLRGRWEILNASPRTIADVAHNEDGIAAVSSMLAEEKFDSLHIVFGAVDDKDLDSILTLLPREAHYYFCEAAVPRALNSALLQAMARKHGLKGQRIESVAQAMNAARVAASDGDLILVTGSVFVVAEALVLRAG
jgi:dihydrofolate synthase/folylpolyglutamate synthase